MSSFVVKILNVAKSVFRIVSKGYCYRRYLHKGIYVLDESRSILIHANKRNDTSISIFRGGKGKFSSFPALLIFGNNNGFDGDMLIVTSQNQIKIFNHKEAKLVTIYKERNDLIDSLNRKENLTKYFASSEIYEVDYDKRLIVEELLTNTVDDCYDLFIHLLDFYVVYYDSIDEMGHYSFPLNHKDANIEKRFCSYYMENANKIMFPAILQHGDMWKGNVFFSDNICKFIDFDNVGCYPVFYDLCLYMFTEAFMGRNCSILNDYLNGKFDTKLSKLKKKHFGNNSDYSNELIFICCIEFMIKKRFDTDSTNAITMSVLDFLRNLGVNL